MNIFIPTTSDFSATNTKRIFLSTSTFAPRDLRQQDAPILSIVLSMGAISGFGTIGCVSVAENSTKVE